MVYDIIREYPGLGSFLYGHWEDIELSTEAFLIIVSGVLMSILATCICGLVGYVLGSLALAKIAKKQGAWRNIRTMACLPFARYFVIGKLAERSDAVHGTQGKRRLWGRLLFICCCVLIPITAAVLLIGIIGVPGTQVFAMLIESSNRALGGADSRVVTILASLAYVLLVLIALPALLLNLISSELFALVMVALPIVGAVCLLVGVVLLAIVRTLCGVCYYKVLRSYFESKVAMILTVIGAVTGLTPIALFVASRKKTQN